MKKMMKSLVALLMSGCMIFGATACDLFTAPTEPSTNPPTTGETPTPTPEVTPEPTIMETSGYVKVKMQVAEREDGADAFVSVQTKTPDMFAETTDSLYLIDDYAFIPYGENIFMKSPSTFWYALEEETGMSKAEIQEMFAGLMQGGNTTEPDTNLPDENVPEIGENETENAGMEELLATINQVAEISVSMSGDVVTIVVDMKQFAQETIDYIGSLKGETKLGEVINDALACISVDCTYDTVLDGILSVKDVTLGEFYEEVSIAVEEETGVGVQEMKNEILSDPTLESVLTAWVGEEEFLSLKSFDIDAFVTEYSEVTLEEGILQMIYGDVQGEETPTLEEIFAEIETALANTTLSQIDADMVAVFEMISTLKVETLQYEIHLTMEGETVENVATVFKVDVRQAVSPLLIQKLVFEVTLDVTFVESVALPDNAEICYVCNDCGYTSEEIPVLLCQICGVYYCEDCMLEHDHNG